MTLVRPERTARATVAGLDAAAYRSGRRTHGEPRAAQAVRP
jgi:hypothetical protein